MNYLRSAKHLLAHRWPVLTVRSSFAIALKFGQSDVEFIHNDKLKTIQQLFSKCAPEFRADYINLRFYGGPIGKGRWYSGTLWSFIHDFIAAKIQMEGLKPTLTLLNQVQC